MKIIIGHPSLDFDALASMVAAKKIYPDATLVTVGKASQNVQDFISLHKEGIEIQNYINKKDVTTMIMVDTRSKKRLQEFATVLDNDAIKIIIYDHHPPCDSEIQGAEIHYEKLGANVTRLVEIIRHKNIDIDPQEATVFALGIYEDTGSLSYASTTYRDIEAAAWLLKKGANLNVIANYIVRAFSEEQQELLNTLMSHCQIKKINGKNILFTTGETKSFVAELALLTGKIRDFHIVDAIFSVVRMGNRIYIVSRSSAEEINVREILKFYGGIGHDHAASATIKDADDTSLNEVVTHLETALKSKIAPPLLLKNIMTSPVKTIDSKTTINEVDRYMMRYGHSGYPVIDEDKVIGIISRRDVEKAKYHGFGKVPVKGYMSHHVISLDENMPVEEAQRIMLQENIGRFPVMRGENLVGIVSRTDLLQILYGEKVVTKHKILYKKTPFAIEHRNMLQKLKESLPEATYQILGEIASLADREGYKVFLVGGLVRDMLLETSSSDLDIVVEGDGIGFARLIATEYDGHLASYERFGTANVVIDGYLKLDIASARTEFYEYPAAMPQVENSTLKQDLYRRDFTINAMAISLNFCTIGTLIDYYNGREDLIKRHIRVLHNLSFVEDPTRIMRALRFSVRYGFTLEEETKLFALKAVEDGVFEKLSYRRIWQEVMISLQEENPYKILHLFWQYGIWTYIFPGHLFNESLKDVSSFLEEKISFLGYLKKKPDIPLVYFLLLTFDFSKEELDIFFEKIDGRRVYKESAYRLNRTKGYIYEEAPTMNTVEWYTFFSELNSEIMITLFLKADKPIAKEIGKAAIRFFQYSLECSRKELKELKGYERSMSQAIWKDLILQKSKGILLNKEEELSYITANIEQGKYKGDTNV